jgi:hypothetical protein
MECWSIGVLEYWSVVVLECWSVGDWSIGVLEYWSAGVLECWSTGALECRSIGVSSIIQTKVDEARFRQHNAVVIGSVNANEHKQISLRAAWARIAVRIIGSWISAIGLLNAGMGVSWCELREGALQGSPFRVQGSKLKANRRITNPPEADCKYRIAEFRRKVSLTHRTLNGKRVFAFSSLIFEWTISTSDRRRQ